MSESNTQTALIEPGGRDCVCVSFSGCVSIKRLEKNNSGRNAGGGGLGDWQILTSRTICFTDHGIAGRMITIKLDEPFYHKTTEV